MTGLRSFLQQHRGLALWLVAAALLVRLLVPAGFMPVVSQGRVTLAPCSGVMPAMAGMAHHDRAPAEDGARHDMPCAFAGLAAPALGAADPVLPVVAAALLGTATFRDHETRPAPLPPRLRPPLRGPPRLS